MENMIFKGDLYIKYYPTTVSELVFDTDDVKKDKMKDMNLDEEELAFAIADFMQNFEQLIEDKNPKSIMSYDYSNNSGFYYLSVDSEGYKLTSEKHMVSGLFVDQDGKVFEKQVNDYCLFETIDELSENFVSLSDFLLKSKYVGFVLEPLKSNLDRLFVLFEYKDTYLVINSNGEYDVISKHHPDISNYMCGEDIHENFDKKNIYLEIFKQRLSSNGLSK